MRILWLSANLLGYELLKEAISLKEFKIHSIITLKKNAKTKMYDGVDFKEWRKFGIPVYRIDSTNDSLKLFRKIKPDLIIMCGWRQIVSKEFLEIPSLGVVGFHPTLLPKGRGSAPIINSILESFKRSGITMLYVSNGLDNGDIIGQEEFEIGEDDYALDVYNKIIERGRKLVKKYLPKIAKNLAPRKPQNESDATYFTKKNLKDNEIKCSDTIEEMYRKIRAFSKPYLGAFIKKDNKKLFIWKAEVKSEI